MTTKHPLIFRTIVLYLVFFFSGCASQLHMITIDSPTNNLSSKRLTGETTNIAQISEPTINNPIITLSVKREAFFTIEEISKKYQVEKNAHLAWWVTLFGYTVGWIVLYPLWAQAKWTELINKEANSPPYSLSGENDLDARVVIKWHPTGIIDSVKTGKYINSKESISTHGLVLIVGCLDKTAKYVLENDGLLSINLVNDLGLTLFDNDNSVELVIYDVNYKIIKTISLNPRHWTNEFVRIIKGYKQVYYNDFESKEISKLSAGQEFEIIDKNGSLIKIAYDENKNGWINSEGIKTFYSVPERFDLKRPPNISIAKVLFVEPSGNQYLDAEETGYIKIPVLNNGKGTGNKITAKISEMGQSGLGLKYQPSTIIGSIKPNGKSEISIPIYAPLNVKSGRVKFKIEVTEANGFDADPAELSFETRIFRSPELVLFDQGIDDANENGIIELGESIDITARIQNHGQGDAINVLATVKLLNDGRNIYYHAVSDKFLLGNLKSGQSQDVKFTVVTNKRFEGNQLPVSISLEEQHKTFDKTITLDLPLNRPLNRTQEIIVQGNDVGPQSIPDINGLSVDIEQNILQTFQNKPYAIAVIIGIRDYQSSDIPKVKYAKRDAQIMREYLVKVLGYDPKNILPQNPDELMTFGNMKSLLRKRLPSYLKPDGSSELFVYYAGHGAPSTESQQPFFVPYDCDPNFVSDDNAYKMSDFYSDLARVNAKKKYIVIDACFSGQSGDGTEIVKNASPVLLKVDNPLFASKDAFVFQSSESNQVSNWYPEKKHGMFTYFFLKGLKGEADLNKDGTITVGEMESYINDENNNLPYVSQREMQRKQRAVVRGNKNAVIFER